MSKTQLQTNNEKYNQLIELLRGKAVGGSVDLSQVTVTPETLFNGFKAYNNEGELVTGTAEYHESLKDTTWYFNETPVPQPNKTFNVSAITDLDSENPMVIKNIQFIINIDMIFQLGYTDETDYANIVYSSDTSWSSEQYRTINFTGGDDVVNSELITFLKENATLIDGSLLKAGNAEGSGANVPTVDITVIYQAIAAPSTVQTLTMYYLTVENNQITYKYSPLSLSSFSRLMQDITVVKNSIMYFERNGTNKMFTIGNEGITNIANTGQFTTGSSVLYVSNNAQSGTTITIRI